MRSRRSSEFVASISLIVIAALFLSCLVNGQQPQGSQPQGEIRLGANEVAVDVIVTDKKGKQLKDLTAADFEISEDGIRQTVKSFTLISRGGSSTNAPGGKVAGATKNLSAEAATEADRRYITLIFDLRMTDPSLQGGLSHSEMAAEQYVDTGITENDLVSIFTIGNGLRMVQRFTNDKKALKEALKRGLNAKDGTNSSTEGNLGKMFSDEITSDAGPARTEGSFFASDTAAGEVYKRLGRILETFQTEKDAEVMVRSLRALISAHRALPGRKAAIFFSEGFKSGTSEAANLKNVISDANQANVALYTIDPAGLRVVSRETERSDELSKIGSSTRNPDSTVVVGGQSRLGRSEALSLGDANSVLDQLAEGTGGFSVRGTNDLRRGIETIDEDLRSYYLLTYEPTRPIFDGSYRKLEVKVKRPDAKVRSREGYYAVRSAGAAPLRSFELSLFSRAYENPAPQALPVKSTVLQFAGPNQQRHIVVISKFPASALQFTPDQKTKVNEANTDTLVLVLAEDNSIVSKFGEQIKWQVTDKQKAQLQATELIARSELNVPGGNYKISVVIADPNAKAATVKTFPLIVPDGNEKKLRLSSAFIVETATSKASLATLPMLNVQVAPSSTGEVRIASGEKFSLAFTAYPPKGSTTAVQVKLEFFQGSAKLAEIPPSPLPAADAEGKIPYLAALPVSAFPKGTYKARITVLSGSDTASEEVTFTVVD